jgi:hypothetical protein
MVTMSRSKDPIHPTVQAIIDRRLPPAEIVRQAALAGHSINERTAARRLSEAKGKPRPGAKPRPPVAVPVNMPAAPDEIPKGASLEQIDEWIAGGEEMLAVAKSDGNLTGWASTQRVLATLRAQRQKEVPPPPPDPDANPDLKRAGKAAAERLHEMIDRAFGPAGPLASRP